MSMCLRQLESHTPLKIRAKLLVRPIGPGSNTVHIAGSVDFPNEELEIRGDWAPLHYEYTSFNKKTVSYGGGDGDGDGGGDLLSLL